MVNIKCLPVDELDDGQIQAWRDIQSASTRFASPYYCPEFTLAVSEVRNDVWVAVFVKDGKAVGFFPFHGRKFGVAQPVGSLLSDFHGAILEPGVTCDWGRVLRACSLVGFEFHHLDETQLPREHCTAEACVSPYIELSGGYDSYIEQRRKNTGEISQVLRKARKAGREEGAVRFVMRSSDPAAWDALIRWKIAQYQRTHATNVFAYRWARELLENLAQKNDRMFTGFLSALYFGDRLVAVHLGMRSKQVLHWWFPTYDASMGKYSPGLILLLETVKAASQQGIHRIDLGKGTERYKQSFMSGSSTIYEGAVDYNRFIHSVRVNKANTRRWFLSTRVGSKAKSVINSLR